MTKASSKRFQFPQHWHYLKSRGINGFKTQIFHTLPNGAVVIWSSRRFRKRHSSELLPPSVFQKQDESPPHKHPVFHYWGWKTKKLSWWIGLIFTLGSILFVLGAIPVMFPNAPTTTIAQINFVGSVCFTIGSYLMLLETINLNTSITHKYSEEKIAIAKGIIKHSQLFFTKIKWFDWLPHRLDFWSVQIQLVGACLFNVNCFFALFSNLTWQKIDLLIWFPSTVASICFCVASYLAVIEVCHCYWAWLPNKIEWWVVILNLVGSWGFLMGSIFGFFGQGTFQCCQQWGTNLSFLVGSLFFLGGSYLMIPETLTE